MGIAIMGNERGQLGFLAPLLITELDVRMLVATYAAQSQEDITWDYSARAPNGLHWIVLPEHVLS
jgi:hypothetical protein